MDNIHNSGIENGRTILGFNENPGGISPVEAITLYAANSEYNGEDLLSFDIKILQAQSMIEGRGITVPAFNRDQIKSDARELILDRVRTDRNALLAGSDWTRMDDNDLDAPTKALWATYRQELRDLPASLTTIESYDEVVWPTAP